MAQNESKQDKMSKNKIQNDTEQAKTNQNDEIRPKIRFKVTQSGPK